LLSELNCDIAQGYAIAKPMDINDFWVWVKRPDVINF
jgi:EAL domain-containing protein (putative c-di-GMP-specific phosphodiesterase class I)